VWADFFEFSCVSTERNAFFLFLCPFLLFGGWGGVGWGNNVNWICTRTHTHTLLLDVFFLGALAHSHHATLLDVLLHLHTRTRTHTHTSCYPTGRSLDVIVGRCNTFMMLCSDIMIGLCYAFIMWCSDMLMGLCNAFPLNGDEHILDGKNSMPVRRNKNTLYKHMATAVTAQYPHNQVKSRS